MNIEQASSNEYKTTAEGGNSSSLNKPYVADIQIDSAAFYDGNLFLEIKISFYYNCTFIIEIVTKAGVYVTDETTNISTTTISTNALSTCIFFLVNFDVYGKKYAFLKHHSKEINPQISAPLLLKHFLDDIWSEMIEILSEDFSLPNSFIYNDIKNIKLLVGGGTPTNNDVVRNAFGLLLNRHELTTNIMFKLLDEKCKYFACNLFDNTKIINPITYQQSKQELNEARGKYIIEIGFLYKYINMISFN
jgi:hypothetical protein